MLLFAILLKKLDTLKTEVYRMVILLFAILLFYCFLFIILWLSKNGGSAKINQI
jgi:hypothetical protein